MPLRLEILDFVKYSEKRVTIMGLGRHGGGVGAVRYLAEQGAMVTITDMADEWTLAESLAVLADVPIAHYVLGRHDERDFREADVVVVNPAVRPDHPLIAMARERGVAITSEIELFLNACPCRIVGVTGSNGKSSTCAMLAGILKASGRRTWLGGNIGGSLLGDLPNMRPGDAVVLELSSFQLHWLNAGTRLPELAVITNCTPNHLDWHGTWEHYVAAKRRLLAGDVVLNPRDPVVGAWASRICGKLIEPSPESSVPPLHVPGRHQRINASLAAAAAQALGCSEGAIAAGLEAFRGLPHRIEFVAEKLGRQFYDDSKSTTPEATIAALDTFDAPPWLLAGGYDKGVNLRPMCEAVGRRAAGAAFYGTTGPQLFEFAQAQSPNSRCASFPELEDALLWCVEQSAAGDTILLSPGCASHDQFRDYAERGQRFAALVHDLT